MQVFQTHENPHSTFRIPQSERWAVLGGTIIVATVAAHTLIQYRTKPAVSAS